MTRRDKYQTNSVNKIYNKTVPICKIRIGNRRMRLDRINISDWGTP